MSVSPINSRSQPQLEDYKGGNSTSGTGRRVKDRRCVNETIKSQKIEVVSMKNEKK